MPLQMIRSDITKVRADAIVNSANPDPVAGSGTDLAVFSAAGYDRLLKEREKIGRIAPGEAAVTDAFDLDAKYIIHTVGPLWVDGAHREADLLASCYRKSMRLAYQLKCASIAFPLISTGVYGFPKDLALDIALKEIGTFLEEADMDVILVVFDRESYQLSAALSNDIRSYIDDRMYVKAAQMEYSGKMSARRRQEQDVFSSSGYANASMPAWEGAPYYLEQPVLLDECEEADSSLEEVLRSASRTFQEQLLMLIDEKGMTDVEVYKKANLDRKLFSKIRSNADYVPKKKTALALAVALELDLDETKDLLSRASLALSPSSAFDIIIEYCIRHKQYNIYEINALLFEYDQQLLGN